MVRWYQPALLLRTGARALLAKLIGQLADNRELQSNDYRGPAQLLDYSTGNLDAPTDDSEDFWLDFVADLGDGWETTYAVAASVARPTLQHDQDELPRARVLILGGDEVYPDPSLDAYLEHTFAPYQAACTNTAEFTADVLAVPGNHDWYDGLHAFEDLFCHDDAQAPEWPFGHWHKRQRQSYFALKLPHRWWLIAPDTQLDGRLNPSQRTFFRGVITQMQPTDSVIIITPEPGWAIYEPDANIDILRWLSAACQRADAEVKLVLTGDLHHYARFDSADGPMLITAGGGGAFKHPTHALPEQIQLSGLKSGVPATQPALYQRQAAYPDPGTSRRLSLKNLMFPITNWELSIFIGVVYTLLAWLLETRQLVGNAQLSTLFEAMLANHGGIAAIVTRLFSMLPKSPEFALMVLLTTLGLIAFNTNCSRLTAIGLGLFHTLLHLIGMILTYCVAVEITLYLQTQFATLSFSFFWFLLMMVLFGGGIGGSVFGLYLLLSLNIFGMNLTNAFSSLRIEGYLNFVRMRFSSDGALTLYPIGIDKPAPAGTLQDTKAIEPPVRIL